MRIHSTGQRGERTVRQRIAIVAMAIGVVLFGIAVAPGVASAHHPDLSGTTSCRTGDTWTVNWTATSAQWRDYWTINASGWSPGGWQFWTTAFTRSVSYPASQESATISVSASWSDSSTGSDPVQGEATSEPVARPPLCTPPSSSTTTTTTTTTTEPEVTTPTTQPEVTTTTTTAGETTTTQPATTTTVEQAGPTTTASVGQQGPTSSVDQSSGASTTQAVGGSLPATGSNSSTSLIVIALTLIGVGAVMLRLTSRPTR